MILEDINELALIDTLDRGVPNEEKIVLLAREQVDVGQYGLILGLKTATGMALPMRDYFIWLGDVLLEKGDWIFVYTGKGEPRITTMPDSQNRIFTAHWGHPITLLHNPDVVPLLIRFDGVIVGEAGSRLIQNNTA